MYAFLAGIMFTLSFVVAPHWAWLTFVFFLVTGVLVCLHFYVVQRRDCAKYLDGSRDTKAGRPDESILRLALEDEEHERQAWLRDEFKDREWLQKDKLRQQRIRAFSETRMGKIVEKLLLLATICIAIWAVAGIFY
jgi:predicted Holliday junction resolvase-like endonuclease